MTPRSASPYSLLAFGALGLACTATPPAEDSSARPTTTTETPVAPPPAPVATSEAPPGPANATSQQDELRVGERTDGATLTAIEVEKTEDGYGLVLSFDGAGRPPITRSRVENPQLVVLTIEGVRGVTATLPVVRGEDGRKLREPRVIERGPVKSLGRGFYGDDSGIRIDVELATLPQLELVEGKTGRTVELRMRPQ